jgi:hypothetical protein
MRRALWLGGAATLLAIVLAVMLYGRETKVTQVSVVCRPYDQPAEPVRWIYTAKIDPSALPRIAPAIDITLHYTGSSPRAAPPITTYFYRQNGATIRVASSAKSTMPPKGTFTYHVDAGGYIYALTATGHGDIAQVPFFIEVDGSYFRGVLSPQNCLHASDLHLDLQPATHVPDLKDKHPLNIAAADWLTISNMPTPVMRTEGSQVSTYAFFSAPIALTDIKNETSVPDDVAKQAAEVGVVAATPTYALTGEPTPTAGKASGAAGGE